jgi:pimeloyl-ACP methyl ester carboxylesterase
MIIDVNGTRLWFDVDGPSLVSESGEMQDRPTVVLLHGGPGSFDHTYFKPDFARLAAEAQVVYLDLRDHGRSAWGDPSDWSFEVCADDVRAFCDSLGIVRPIVLGHSMGGFVAMLYAARHPGHAGALVLQSTLARFDLDRMVETFRRTGGDEVAGIVARVYGGDSLSVTPEEWAPCWRLFGPWVPERGRGIVNSKLNAPGLALMLRLNILDQLAKIECPTLVCVGSLDPCTPVAASREIVEALPAGIARLEVIEGAGHFTWRDTPDLYWTILTEFVRGGDPLRLLDASDSAPASHSP